MGPFKIPGLVEGKPGAPAGEDWGREKEFSACATEVDFGFFTGWTALEGRLENNRWKGRALLRTLRDDLKLVKRSPTAQFVWWMAEKKGTQRMCRWAGFAAGGPEMCCSR